MFSECWNLAIIGREPLLVNASLNLLDELGRNFARLEKNTQMARRLISLWRELF